MIQQTLIHIINIKVVKNLAGNMLIVLIVVNFKMNFVKSSNNPGRAKYLLRSSKYIIQNYCSKLKVSCNFDELIPIKGYT